MTSWSGEAGPMTGWTGEGAPTSLWANLDGVLYSEDAATLLLLEDGATPILLENLNVMTVWTVET
jgi:hypothetical protein